MIWNIFRYLFKFSLWQPLNVHAEMPLIVQLDTMNGRFKHFTLVKIPAKIGVFKRSKLITDPMALLFTQIRRGCQRRRSRMPVGLFVCLFVCANLEPKRLGGSGPNLVYLCTGFLSYMRFNKFWIWFPVSGKTGKQKFPADSALFEGHFLGK